MTSTKCDQLELSTALHGIYNPKPSLGLKNTSQMYLRVLLERKDKAKISEKEYIIASRQGDITFTFKPEHFGCGRNEQGTRRQ